MCGRYANRAKNIKNKPKINEDPKDALLREFQEEITRLKAALDAKGGGGRKKRGRKQPRTGPDGVLLLLLKLFVSLTVSILRVPLLLILLCYFSHTRTIRIIVNLTVSVLVVDCLQTYLHILYVYSYLVHLFQLFVNLIYLLNYGK